MYIAGMSTLFMRLKQQRLWQFGVFVLKRCLELRLHRQH